MLCASDMTSSGPCPPLEKKHLISLLAGWLLFMAPLGLVYLWG